MSMTLAFFDMDGTITRKDTFIDFIIFVVGRKKYVLNLLHLFPYILLYYLGLFRNDKLKEKFVLRYLTSFSFDVLQRFGSDYATKKLSNIIYPQALAKLHWHLDNGHKVIILTASSKIWLGDWCTKMNIDIIGTEYEINKGRLTGRILGANCHGLIKQIKVKEILESYPEAYTFGYGNEKSDLMFLDIMNESFYRPFS